MSCGTVNENVRNLLQFASSTPAVSLDRECKRVEAQQVLNTSSHSVNISYLCASLILTAVMMGCAAFGRWDEY